MLGFTRFRSAEQRSGTHLRKEILCVAVFLIGAAFIAPRAPIANATQPQQKWTTEGVLEMMDRSAKDFRSLSADLENTKYTAVVQDASTETGQIFVRHDSKMRIDITKPEPRTILRTGDLLFLYNPKLNRVEEYDLGKNRAMVDQYVRLGFGTKSEDLRKSYLVTVLGEEDVDHRKTILLELTPKSDSVRAQITKIHMWVDQASWLPVEQKFFEAGSGDYILFHYTNMMKNLKIAESKFKQDWPKNASHERPRA